MSLAFPLGLLGLLSLPVILALHLLRERQRRYVVSYLELWSFLEQSISGPRIRRLPLTLILLLDLLAAALFSLALAQPHVSLDLPLASAKQQVILLDVSSSMRAVEGGARRFERARAAAMALLEDSAPQDPITLVTFGGQARLLADAAPVDGAELAQQLAALQPGETGSPQALQEALALGQSTLDPELPAEFTVITDGSFPFDPQAALAGFAYPLTWRWIGEPQDNQAVIDLNATHLEENRYQVFTRVANFGGRAVRRSLALEVDGRPVDQVDVGIPPDASVTHVWQTTIPAAEAASVVEVTLRGSDRLPDDDRAAIGLQPAGRIRVALVANEPGALQQAIQVIPGAELTVIPPGDYAEALGAGAIPGAEAAPAYELTIFRGYVPPAWPPGLALVVDPPRPDDPAVGVTSSWYAEGRDEIPSDAAIHAPNPSPLVAGIDFSGVRWSRAWRLADAPSDGIPPGFLPLLEANQTPLLLIGTPGRSGLAASPAGPQAGALPVTGDAPAEAALASSRVVVLLADLAFGNFTKHPAFPILMANLVEFARQSPAPPGFHTGEAVPLPAPGSYRAVQVIPPGQAPTAFENTWPARWEDTLEPGVYQFRFIQADGTRAAFAAGAWAGDALESDLRPRSWTGQGSLSGSGRRPGSPEQAERDIDLRPWLLGAAIAILLWEAYLAWRR